MPLPSCQDIASHHSPKVPITSILDRSPNSQSSTASHTMNSKTIPPPSSSKSWLQGLKLLYFALIHLTQLASIIVSQDYTAKYRSGDVCIWESQGVSQSLCSRHIATKLPHQLFSGWRTANCIARPCLLQDPWAMTNIAQLAAHPYIFFIINRFPNKTKMWQDRSTLIQACTAMTAGLLLMDPRDSIDGPVWVLWHVSLWLTILLVLSATVQEAYWMLTASPVEK